MLAHNLANSLVKQGLHEKALQQCKKIYLSTSSTKERAQLSEICPEFRIVLKIVELATQVDN